MPFGFLRCQKAEKNSEKGKTGLFQIFKYTYLGGLVVYIHFYIGGGNSNISLIFYTIAPKIGEDEAIITITITIIIIFFMIFIIYIIIMILILIALNIKNTRKCTTNSKQQERRTKNKKKQKGTKTTKNNKKNIGKETHKKKIIPKTIPHPLYS